jgi:hypothetical protein
MATKKPVKKVEKKEAKKPEAKKACGCGSKKK